MYLIVLFEEENRTGLVAKEWFSDGLAWWPPYRDILRNVQKRILTQPTKGWRQYAARILYESGNFQYNALNTIGPKSCMNNFWCCSDTVTF